MPLVTISEYLAAPGQEDRLRTALEAMIEPSLDEPGCLAYQLYADPNRPARMATIEEWTDREALEEYAVNAHRQHLGLVLTLVLAEPMTVRTLTAAPPG